MDDYNSESMTTVRMDTMSRNQYSGGTYQISGYFQSARRFLKQPLASSQLP